MITQKVNYGTDSDLQIYHDGTDGYVQNGTGNLIIEQTTNDVDIVFKNDDGSGGTIEYFRIDGSESRVVYGRSIHMADNVSIFLGNDDDGLIRYDSTADKILYTGTSQFSNDLTVVGDFTVDTDTLFVDVSEDSVGIGLTNPADYTADELVISVPDESGMTLVSGTTDAAYISFADATGTSSLNNYIRFDHNDDTMSINNFGGSIKFSTGEAVDKMTIASSGVTVEDDFIAGNLGDPYLLTVDVSTATVYVAGTLDAIDIEVGDGHTIGDDANDNLLIKSSAAESIIIDSEDELFFSTGNGLNTRMSIGSTGIVKIGTGTLITPSADADDLVIDRGAGVATGITLDAVTSGQINFATATDNDKGSILYNGGTNYMQFRTNGTERMRITGVGNIGLGGNTNPQQKIDIANGGIQIQGAINTPASGQRGLFLHYSTSLGDARYLSRGADNTTRGTHTFYSQELDGGNEITPLVIDSSGNVGIGTTSPNAILEIASGNSGGDAALDAPVFRINNTTESSDWDTGDVVGTIEYYTSDASGNAPYVTSFIKSVNETGNGTLPDGALTFGTATYNASGGAVERMRIDSSGDVTIQTSGADDIKNFTINSSNGSSQVAGLVIQNDGANGYIHFKAGAGGATPTTKLTIGNAANSGNVGIGTTTPQTTLQVNGAASALNAHFGQGTNNSSGVFGGISLGYSESSNASYRKVGIVAKAIGDGAARQELHFLVNSNADSNSAGIADTKMMISTSGNVGIGTTSPSEKLTVNGNIESLDTIILKNSGGHKWQQLFQNTNDFVIRYNNTSTWSEKLRIESDGDVVLTEGNLTMSGATPFIVLSNTAETESGITLLDSADAAQSAKITYDASGNVLKFYNNASNERMRIDSSGHIYQGTVGEAANKYYYFQNSTTADAGLVFKDNASTNSGYLTYNHGDDAMKFGVNGSERMRILSSGGITFNGDTSTANALDDYEEGTWTPTNLGTIGLSTAPSSLSGRYTKIGRQVIVSFALAGYSCGTGIKAIVIGGFPFIQHSAAHTETGYCSTYPHSDRRSGIVIDNSGGDSNNWFVGFKIDTAASNRTIRGTVMYTTT